MKNEEQIIRACCKGDSLAWKILYNNFAPLIKGIALRYEKDTNKVSDLLQDIFLKIHANISKFNGEGSFEGWIKRIAVNTCIDYVNRNKKLSEQFFSFEFDFEDEIIDDDISITNSIINAGIGKNELLEMINALPENYATVFNLFFIDEWSHHEIGEKLQISESLSRKWAFRAKESLKKQLISLLNAKQYGK